MLKLAVVASQRKVGPGKSEREYDDGRSGYHRPDMISVWSGLVLNVKCCLSTDFVFLLKHF